MTITTPHDRPTTDTPDLAEATAPPGPGIDAGIERSRLEAVRRSADLERRIASDPAGLRVLTGDRPTGRLHLGHLFGSLDNRVRLQRAGVDTMIVLADYQVITDRDAGGADRGRITASVREIVCDHLAAGIDPSRATMFVHSAVPELNQLMVPMLSLVSAAELQRNPTVKAETLAAGLATVSGLMLTYPVHQAADICGVDGTVVPVGLDQLPHLEVTRLIVRRFTERYGPALRMPEPLLSRAPVVLGLDGDKMSKSRGNAIALGATADETVAAIRSARTDSERRISYDPRRRPGVSNLLLITALCTDEEPETIAERIGDAGSGELKRRASEALNTHLAPLRARRAEFVAAGDDVLQVVRDGNIRARATATATLERVRNAMGMRY